MTLWLGLCACENSFSAPRGEVLKSAGPIEVVDDHEHEAKANLLRLYEATNAYWEESRQLAPTAPLTPAMPCAVDSFSQPTWRALRFSVAGRSHYQYEYVTNGTAVTIRAVGIAACNGVNVVWELRCRTDLGSGLQCEPLAQVK
jgi:hypothetical protein